MAKDFLGKGWAFPVGVDGKGFFRTSEGESEIREAIMIILSTAPGERVMRPDFGCGIHDYTFEAISTTTTTLIESSVRSALQRWEPRIEVNAVTVAADRVTEGRLEIGVDYTIRTTNNQFNLVYPFYLTEGG